VSRLRGPADPPGSARDEIHIEVNGGYRPAVAMARAGVPIRIVFERRDADVCTDRVVFSSPRLERRLTPNGPTSVDLPARPAGEIRYTCGMGRYSGVIRVVDHDSDRARWLRREVRAADSALAVVFTVTVVGLPIVAAMALLLLGGTPALVAAAAAAAAAVGAVLWLLGGRDEAHRGHTPRDPLRGAKPGIEDTDPTPSTRRTS
jgi:hypothetical protein